MIDETLHAFMEEKTSITRCGKNDLALSFDYIEAIYDAAVFLKKNNCFGQQMIINIFGCYNHYQQALLLNGAPSNELKQHLKWLFALDELKQEFKKPNILQFIVNKIPQIAIINNKITPFPQTFIEWLEEFSNESNSN